MRADHAVYPVLAVTFGVAVGLLLIYPGGRPSTPVVVALSSVGLIPILSSVLPGAVRIAARWMDRRIGKGYGRSYGKLLLAVSIILVVLINAAALISEPIVLDESFKAGVILGSSIALFEVSIIFAVAMATEVV